MPQFLQRLPRATQHLRLSTCLHTAPRSSALLLLDPDPKPRCLGHEPQHFSKWGSQVPWLGEALHKNAAAQVTPLTLGPGISWRRLDICIFTIFPGDLLHTLCMRAKPHT